MAPVRAFSTLQKWPEMAKMTPLDRLTLKKVLIELPRKNEQNTFSFKKLIVFGNLERKNEFHSNHASYESNLRLKPCCNYKKLSDKKKRS